ncbi:hypothetical protein [Qipengyuania mesophila]|uniref:hypothetical protein n=1 Tax=Qipengyuania mesophila TaxID=2867246 RepID=UPI003517763B
MSEPALSHDTAQDATLSGEATLVEQWAAVEDAARVVAMLAGRPAPLLDPHGEARIGLLARAHPPRSQSAVFALHELVATMRAGLDALLAAHGTAANSQVAARRLWSEYERGRSKVLAEAAAALGGW